MTSGVYSWKNQGWLYCSDPAGPLSIIVSLELHIEQEPNL